VRLSTGAATVLPGEHTVEVTYSELNRGYSLLGTILLAWKAEAGHTYIVDKIIHSAPGMSKMLIIDSETKKEVSRSLLKPVGKQSAQNVETKTKEFPQRADFWAYKGYLLVMLQRYVEGMSALDTALNLQPDMADAWLTKSLAFFQQKRYDESLKTIDKTIQLRGSEEDRKFKEEILKKIEEKKKAQSQQSQ
jgi:tetratricopeptide (TPR) repeat protein